MKKVKSIILTLIVSLTIMSCATNKKMTTKIEKLNIDYKGKQVSALLEMELKQQLSLRAHNCRK
jgi:hypothetical protein